MVSRHANWTHKKMSKWLDSLPLRFGVRGDSVEIITEPSGMYNKILALTKTSSKRIAIASLYLGNGHLEKQLVSHLEQGLNEKPELKVHVLLDHCRGSRGDNNSRTMMLSCLANHPKRATLSLFHTPNLKGILKQFTPDRFNELLGLQHIKLYVFDNTVMLSGANLSNDYFTNRQDRCIVINDCSELADYCSSLIKTVAHFSYQVDGDNRGTLHPSCRGDPTKHSKTSIYIEHASEMMKEFIVSQSNTLDSSRDTDTWIYPVIQMGPFGVNQEHHALTNFFKSTEAEDEVYMSTAYFNPLEEYISLMTRHSPAQYHLLTASPQANGFTGAAGVAKYIPMGYRWFESRFLKYVSQHSQSHRVKLYEYTRDNWTFHSKGLWCCNSARMPFLTVIGSSNYGYRSVHRDLEAQMVLVTRNRSLQVQLGHERDVLYSRGEVVDPSLSNSIVRKFPMWTRLVSRFARHWF